MEVVVVVVVEVVVVVVVEVVVSPGTVVVEVVVDVVVEVVEVVEVVVVVVSTEIEEDLSLETDTEPLVAVAVTRYEQSVSPATMRQETEFRVLSETEPRFCAGTWPERKEHPVSARSRDSPWFPPEYTVALTVNSFPSISFVGAITSRFLMDKTFMTDEDGKLSVRESILT